MTIGTLYLVPTPLDHGCESLTPLHQALPQGTIEIAASLTHWISENAKSTRAFLGRVNAITPLAQPIQAQHITELPHAIHKKGDHPGSGVQLDARALLAPALQGHNIGLISEAGMPAIADPGSSVVRAAHDLGLPVVPLIGPVSILLALAASGLNGQRFAFTGYLPQDDAARTRQLRQLQARALKTGETQLFIETPYRNPALMRSLLTTLDATTRLTICTAVTLPQAHVLTRTVAQWREQSDGQQWNGRLPTVYAIGV
jgi:16S rRNA (cytidine1402-2'-O)-methyltransferase